MFHEESVSSLTAYCKYIYYVKVICCTINPDYMLGRSAFSPNNIFDRLYKTLTQLAFLDFFYLA